MDEYCLKESTENTNKDTNKSNKSLFLNKNNDDLLFSLAQAEIIQCKNENKNTVAISMLKFHLKSRISIENFKF